MIDDQFLEAAFYPVEYLAEGLNIEPQILTEYSIHIWGTPKEGFTVPDLIVIFQYSEIYSSVIKPLEPIPGFIKFISSLEKSVTQEHLYRIVFECYANHIKMESSELGRVHSWCRENLTKEIPNSKLVKVKARNGKLPDFIIEIDGVEYPVECKLKFDKRDIMQIQMYMDLWEVDTGYVVAPCLNTELPENIIYIQSP